MNTHESKETSLFDKDRPVGVDTFIGDNFPCKVEVRQIQNSTETEFGFENRRVRTVIVNGEPWFVAKDICNALDLTWDGHRCDHIPNEWKGMVFITTPGGNQEFTGLSEQGLYFLLARSNKPKALPFQKWISGEVLPAIRKTGSYSIKQSDDQLIVVGYEAAIRKIKLLQDKISEDRPKVESAEALMRCDQNMCITEAAKHFGLHPKLQVFPYLRARGYLTSKDLPTQDALDSGILSVRQNQIRKGNFYSQAVVEKSALELWRTVIVPRINEWIKGNYHPRRAEATCQK